MLTIRKASERGHFDHGWLRTWHSFSFADYFDPEQMGWGPLRVINEDIVVPGTGFGMHGHRDMEIVTYLLSGALAHRDSLGNGTVIRPPDIQRMSAGSGVRHSEANPAADEPVHLLQIWIEPAVRGIAPEYEQRAFPEAGRRGRLQAIASPDGRDGSLVIHQDAVLYAAVLEAGQALAHPLAPGRRAYAQAVRGGLAVNGVTLAAGDGARIWDEATVTLAGTGAAEVLLFDLP
jgi:redox-sensitive bicupin YhaK (pirin superfamily)